MVLKIYKPTPRKRNCKQVLPALTVSVKNYTLRFNPAAVAALGLTPQTKVGFARGATRHEWLFTTKPQADDAFDLTVGKRQDSEDIYLSFSDKVLATDILSAFNVDGFLRFSVSAVPAEWDKNAPYYLLKPSLR